MANNTIAKTYRFSTGLYTLITTEAEKLKTTEADVVRLALRSYFDEKQKQDLLLALEGRLSARVDAQAQRLTMLVQQIISLAQNN